MLANLFWHEVWALFKIDPHRRMTPEIPLCVYLPCLFPRSLCPPSPPPPSWSFILKLVILKINCWKDHDYPIQRKSNDYPKRFRSSPMCKVLCWGMARSIKPTLGMLFFHWWDLIKTLSIYSELANGPTFILHVHMNKISCVLLKTLWQSSFLTHAFQMQKLMSGEFKQLIQSEHLFKWLSRFELRLSKCQSLRS